MFDFPPAPKLDEFGLLREDKATEQELKGQEVFFGKGTLRRCAIPPPFYLDDKMHDLHLERFYEPEMVNDHYTLPDGPIKTFTLRGIKDSPPYHHDGRLLTLEDTVEFFNLVLQLDLDQARKGIACRIYALPVIESTGEMEHEQPWLSRTNRRVVPLHTLDPSRYSP